MKPALAGFQIGRDNKRTRKTRNDKRAGAARHAGATDLK
jgi:hypothetical protein